MGVLRGIGKYTGKAAGFLVGGAVNAVGEATGSKFIKEVGDGVKKASEFAGDTLGQAADGVWKTASGMIQKDNEKVDNGLGNIGDSVSRTAKGVFATAKNTYYSGKEVYEGLKTNDSGKIKKGASDIGKTAAVGLLAVGVVDLVDGVDIGDPVDKNQTLATGDTQSEYNLDHAQSSSSPDTTDSLESHHVKPHWVEGHWRDGHWVDGYWRDGDGNSSVNLTEEQGGGYSRSNPDGTFSNNY
jgi:hypothetical protein